MSDAPGPAALARRWVADLEMLLSDRWAGWSRREPRVEEIVLGVPAADFNNVVIDGADVAPEAVADAIDRVATAGLPFSLHAIDGAEAVVAPLAAERGLASVGPFVILGIDEPIELADRDGVAVVECEPAELPDYRQVLVDGFGMPPALAELTSDPTLLALPGIHPYLGRLDGAPTSTSLSIVEGELATIYSVATAPAYRRRGHGAAITARTVNDALAAGARWAVLHPSSAGDPLYRGLGFVEIAGWPVWATPSPTLG